MLPDYAALDLGQLDLWHGYYTLGLIQRYRSDIQLLPFRLARRDRWNDADHDPTLLREDIDQALGTGKKVLITPWEEDFMGQRDQRLTDLLNRYRDDPVWLLSEMDETGQGIYRHYHGFDCKILELPFVLVNDAVCYAKIRGGLSLAPAAVTNHNFLCMIGRPEQHKFDLITCLEHHNLAHQGLITTATQTLHWILNEKLPRYHVSELLTDHRKEAAQIQIKDVWVSSNVENFLHIESTYDAPLIINAESTMGIFPATEKSIWPALLGKMYLVQAKPGAMRYIQRFHDVDQRRWADLGFDDLDGWDDAAHMRRRSAMISANKHLITNARDIYQTLRPDLDSARYRFAETIYEFFKEQVDNI